MRKILKFLHSIASCGIIGALGCYAIVLIYAPQDSPRAYADARELITIICNLLLLPSLGVALVTGLLAMVAHKAFMDTRWAWLKALLGLSMFEATFAIVQSKATTAAAEAAKLAGGSGDAAELAAALANEWGSLGAIFALSLAQVALGVWRPRLVTPTERARARDA